MFTNYYRERLHPITAVQLTYQNLEAVAEFMREHGGGIAGLQVRHMGPLAKRGIAFGTLHGIDEAYVGDWIVRDLLGSFSACPIGRFEDRYDLVVTLDPPG